MVPTMTRHHSQHAECLLLPLQARHQLNHFPLPRLLVILLLRFAQNRDRADGSKSLTESVQCRRRALHQHLDLSALVQRDSCFQINTKRPQAAKPNNACS